MTTSTINSLSTNDALVLQQIAECGQESLDELMYDTHMSQGRLHALVERLKHKGSVKIQYDFEEILISLSTQGKHVLKQIWPQQQYAT